MERPLFRIGLLGTVLYVVMLWWIFGGATFDVRGLEPNAIGDFLAGVFSPLAFWWLVIGYRMQALELAENREAMVQQAYEAGQLVKVTREQLEAERQAREEERQRTIKQFAPILRCILNSRAYIDDANHFCFELSNYGERITGVTFYCESKVIVGLPTERYSLPNGASIEFKLVVSKEDDGFDPFILKVSYTDGLKHRDSVRFLFSLSEDESLWGVDVELLEDSEPV